MARQNANYKDFRIPATAVFPDTVETLRLYLRRPVTADAERIF
jgi:hypothetical protein